MDRMEAHNQTENVSYSGLDAAAALNHEEDQRMLASSYILYKIGTFIYMYK